MSSLPARIGRYPIEKEIGHGGMGVVYLALDETLERAVAIKVLPDQFGQDEDRLSCFQREARILASLSHPNLGTIFGLERRDEGSRFIVMEYIPGLSLGEKLRGGGLSVEETLQICVQIARALEAAHGRGVIHRDLKPENIRITGEGLVKVLDFGLARREDTGEAPSASWPSAPSGAGDETAVLESVDGPITGTPGYMSPEQARGRAQDRRTDIFSFGCVLYECLTGRAAFPGSTLRERLQGVLDRDPDWENLPSQVPGRIRDLLVACLEKDPGRRLSTMGEVRSRIEEVLEGRRGRGRAAFGPGRAVPGNLPRQLTSFIGRRRESEEVGSLLRESALLTLTGVGGVGKTRLALQVAEFRQKDFPDGVWVVELAPVSDPALVPVTVAATIGIREQPAKDPLQALVDEFHGRRSLLVLDNCEHLVDACGELSQALLRNCPDLVILATSREALGVAGERTWQVPSMSMESSGVESVSLDTIDATGELARAPRASLPDGAQLFLERARAVVPGLDVPEEDLEVILGICRRLDGIPLAIELAASRVRLLSVRQIQERLDHRFRLLVGGSRAALQRHQTLRAAIEWSYGLLSDDEKRLFRALSVFAGGWNLEAAVAVCACGQDELEVLDLLTHLVDKSLVYVDEGTRGQPRYRLLETLREFAWEELDRSGQAEKARDRHLDFYLEFARTAGPKLRTAEQKPWLARCDQEHDNILAAVRWCGSERVDRELAVCNAIWWYWYVRGHFAIGRSTIEAALSCDAQGAPSEERANALSAAGVLAGAQGDYAAARSLLQESLALSRKLGNEKAVGRALNNLGYITSRQRDLTGAAACYTQAIEIWGRLEDPANLAIALNGMGTLALSSGDLVRAREYLERSLKVQEKRGDRYGVAAVLTNLGLLAQQESKPALARSLYQKALAVHEELGNVQGVTSVLTALGASAQAEGDVATARDCYERCLAAVRKQGDRQGIANVLNNLGTLALGEASPERARGFYEEALEIQRSLGNRHGAAVSLGNLALVRVMLGDTTGAREAYRDGLAVRLEEGDRLATAGLLEGTAGLAMALGAPEWCARLSGAAARLRDELERPLPASERSRFDHPVAQARAVLGEDAFADAWERGTTIPWESAAAEALRWLAGESAPATAGEEEDPRLHPMGRRGAVRKEQPEKQPSNAGSEGGARCEGG